MDLVLLPEQLRGSFQHYPGAQDPCEPAFNLFENWNFESPEKTRGTCEQSALFQDLLILETLDELDPEVSVPETSDPAYQFCVKDLLILMALNDMNKQHLVAREFSLPPAQLRARGQVLKKPRKQRKSKVSEKAIKDYVERLGLVKPYGN
tara:strand:+ start:7668 stop:8117 length:450 start_codon:yes stop_codon:yes gene_type:complete